jgi:hypothetical protein
MTEFDFQICASCRRPQPMRVAHSEASHLLAREPIAYIDILISRAITAHRKRRGHVPKIFAPMSSIKTRRISSQER